MAWIYSQESEDSPKPSTGTAGRSPIVKTIDTPQGFYSLEWLEAIYREPRYGTTLKRSRRKCSRPSILSMVGSRAKTFPWQDAEKVWAASEAGFSLRSLGLLATYDPGSSSWRTSQRLLFEAQNELLGSFAASGMTLDGGFYPLRTWARTTKGKGGGYWRTPDTGSGGASGLLKKGIKTRKSGAAITIRLVDQVNNPKMRPTPASTNGTGGATGLAGGAGNRLKLYKMLGKEEGKKMACQSLNPYWVEWLMGYHFGWTVLEDWAMQWFRPKRGKRLSV